MAQHGGFPWDPSGFPSPPWEKLVSQIIPPEKMQELQSGPPLVLALPCIGIDACCCALKRLGIPFSVPYAYDVQSCLAGPLTALHGNIDHFCLGSIQGDLLCADISSWDPCDGVVAGPPCPPWSMIGERGSWDDPRAAVFNKVTDIIVDQGKKGCKFFIVEMVEGMDTIPGTGDRSRHSSSSGSSLSPYQEWFEDLSRRAPVWRLQKWTGQAHHYLPQHRQRIYTIGTNKQQLFPALPPPIPPVHKRLTLSEVLHPGIPPNQEHTLSDRLSWHLCCAKARFLDRVRRENNQQRGELTVHGSELDVSGRWLTIELDRSPDGEWGTPVRTDGSVPTLRTKHKATWVVRFSCTRRAVISRWLHPIEHLTLQGFPPETSIGLTCPEIIHVAGNACTVPVMAGILLRVLSRVRFPTHGGPLTAPSLPRQLDAMRLTDQLRAEIAWLQAETIALTSQLEVVTRLHEVEARRNFNLRLENRHQEEPGEGREEPGEGTPTM